jgi:hypothetical protein
VEGSMVRISSILEVTTGSEERKTCFASHNSE